jgi:hypothetical protein
MTPKLEFDKEKHIYTHNGKRVLSVTTVLPDIPEHLLYKQFFIDAGFRGNRVHDYADKINKFYIDNKKKIPSSEIYQGKGYVESDEPYIKGYLKFLKAHKPDILMSEQKMLHKEFSYAGTMDLVAILKGKKTVLDIKTTSKIAPYARLQLAAYVFMHNENHPENEVHNRCIIHLLPTGLYKLVHFKIDSLESDFEEFYHKLRSAQWDVANMSGKYAN